MAVCPVGSEQLHQRHAVGRQGETHLAVAHGEGFGPQGAFRDKLMDLGVGGIIRAAHGHPERVGVQYGRCRELGFLVAAQILFGIVGFGLLALLPLYTPPFLDTPGISFGGTMAQFAMIAIIASLAMTIVIVVSLMIAGGCLLYFLIFDLFLCVVKGSLSKYGRVVGSGEGLITVLKHVGEIGLFYYFICSFVNFFSL